VAGLLFRIDDSKAKQKLAAAEAALGSQELYGVIGAKIANRVRLCFKLGIDPWGKAWKPIKFRAPRKDSKGRKSQTGRRQAGANAAGTPGQPLRDTGRLQRSISSQPDATGVTVGTNLIYARVHQFGAEIVPKQKKLLAFPGPFGAIVFAKKVVVPARPFLPLRKGSSVVVLPPEWSAEVVRAARAFVLQKLSTVKG
jgi:phage gpG-like protein